MSEDNLDNFVKKTIKAIDPSATDETIKEVQEKTRIVLDSPEKLSEALSRVQIGDKIKTTDDFITEAINEAGRKLREGEED